MCCWRTEWCLAGVCSFLCEEWFEGICGGLRFEECAESWKSPLQRAAEHHDMSSWEGTQSRAETPAHSAGDTIGPTALQPDVFWWACAVGPGARETEVGILPGG